MRSSHHKLNLETRPILMGLLCDYRGFPTSISLSITFHERSFYLFLKVLATCRIAVGTGSTHAAAAYARETLGIAEDSLHRYFLGKAELSGIDVAAMIYDMIFHDCFNKFCQLMFIFRIIICGFGFRWIWMRIPPCFVAWCRPIMFHRQHLWRVCECLS